MINPFDMKRPILTQFLDRKQFYLFLKKEKYFTNKIKTVFRKLEQPFQQHVFSVEKWSKSLNLRLKRYCWLCVTSFMNDPAQRIKQFSMFYAFSLARKGNCWDDRDVPGQFLPPTDSTQLDTLKHLNCLNFREKNISFFLFFNLKQSGTYHKCNWSFIQPIIR